MSQGRMRQGERRMRVKSRRGRPKQNEPHPVDIHVGLRLRERRTELGISQTNLAASLGLTFQQVQKYEQAKNRISASRLYRFGKILGVPVTFFFEGIVSGTSNMIGDYADPLDTPEAAELSAAYRAIPEPLMRRRLKDLASALAAGSNGSSARTYRSEARSASRRSRS